jgi:Molecular chaperone GrpE (heat shock protein)
MEKKETTENPEITDNVTDNTSDEVSMPQSEEENQSENSAVQDKLAAELSEMKDAYLRLMAEYDNYRKRTLKEKADLIKNGGEKVLVGLLPVIDDFERALQNISEATDMDAVMEGVKLIYSKFISFLNQNGVKAIEALNEPFDVELFDAVATIPAPDKEMKGKVVDCVQTGYYLNDKVIRHPKVVVAE